MKDSDLNELKRSLKRMILSQTDEFTAYDITNRYIELQDKKEKKKLGIHEAKNVWSRIHRHTGSCIADLRAKGAISKGREVDSDKALRQKRLYKVIRKDTLVD